MNPVLILGPLWVLFCGVAAWHIGMRIGDHLANKRDRTRELAASRRPSAATIAALERDTNVPLADYVTRHIDRELGLTPQPPPDRIRRFTGPNVCLTKNCGGDTIELASLSFPTHYIHTCRRPA